MRGRRSRWSQQGAAWYVTARTGVHAARVRPERGPPRRPEPAELRDSDHVGRRRAGVRARREGIRNHRHPDARAAAFYVYVPYRNQSNAPVFDTAIDDFNFGQLFSVNRYLGNDRIGDANQLSLALTSRLLDAETGAERFRVAVGERFYFNDQRVVLNETPRSANNSDFLVGVEGRLSDAWALIGLWQYNFEAIGDRAAQCGRPLYAGAGPGAERELPVLAPELRSARRTDRRRSRRSTNGTWRGSGRSTRTGRCSAAGTTRSSASKTLEAVAGVEYNAGCWVLRLVGQRLTTTTQTATNSVYLQIELNGLARFGTSPLDLLRRSVPGYLKTNDPTRVAARPQHRFLPGILDGPMMTACPLSRFSRRGARSLAAACRRRARPGADTAPPAAARRAGDRPAHAVARSQRAARPRGRHRRRRGADAIRDRRPEEDRARADEARRT